MKNVDGLQPGAWGEEAIPVLDIGWSSTVDGPGRRVVVYVQGCPLRCPWCHSPHSQPLQPHLLFFAERCLHCGTCRDICPQQVHHVDGRGHHWLDWSACTNCGTCISHCPASGPSQGRSPALRLSSEQLSVDQLYQRIGPQARLLRSMGGITISGGEPLLHGAAVSRLLARCRAEGIPTCVETSGVGNRRAVDMLLPQVDCWLFGYRPLPPGHPASDLVGNPQQILQTLRYVAQQTHGQVILRLPLIPGHTDSPATWLPIAQAMVQLGLQHLQLLPWNPMAAHYYHATGRDLPVSGAGDSAADPLPELVAFFAAYPITVTLVQETGSTVLCRADGAHYPPVIPHQQNNIGEAL